MSDQVPVLRARNHTTPATVDESRSVLGYEMELAAALAKSDLVPRDFRNKPANVLVAIGLGRTLGLEPAAALSGLHVIEGRPIPSAKVQAALVRRAGHKLRIIETTGQVATVEIVRADDPEYPVKVSFTIEMAARAGWLDTWVERWVKTDGGRSRKDVWTYPQGLDINATAEQRAAAGAPDWAQRAEPRRKDNWWTQPEAMLHHRAVTRAVGQACPEVVSGLDFEVQPSQRDVDPEVDPVVAAAELAPVVMRPAAEPTVKTERATPEADGDQPQPDPQPDPQPAPEAETFAAEPWTPATYRKALKAAGLTVSDALKAAAAHDPEVTSIDSLLSAPELAARVLDEAAS